MRTKRASVKATSKRAAKSAKTVLRSALSKLMARLIEFAAIITFEPTVPPKQQAAHEDGHRIHPGKIIGAGSAIFVIGMMSLTAAYRASEPSWDPWLIDTMSDRTMHILTIAGLLLILAGVLTMTIGLLTIIARICAKAWGAKQQK